MNTQQSSSNLTANKQPQLDINNTSTRLVQSQQQKQQISDDSDSSQFTLNTIEYVHQTIQRNSYSDNTLPPKIIMNSVNQPQDSNDRQQNQQQQKCNNNNDSNIDMDWLTMPIPRATKNNVFKHSKLTFNNINHDNTSTTMTNNHIFNNSSSDYNITDEISNINTSHSNNNNDTNANKWVWNGRELVYKTETDTESSVAIMTQITTCLSPEVYSINDTNNDKENNSVANNVTNENMSFISNKNNDQKLSDKTNNNNKVNNNNNKVNNNSEKSYSCHNEKSQQEVDDLWPYTTYTTNTSRISYVDVVVNSKSSSRGLSQQSESETESVISTMNTTMMTVNKSKDHIKKTYGQGPHRSRNT